MLSTVILGLKYMCFFFLPHVCALIILGGWAFIWEKIRDKTIFTYA